MVSNQMKYFLILLSIFCLCFLFSFFVTATGRKQNTEVHLFKSAIGVALFVGAYFGFKTLFLLSKGGTKTEGGKRSSSSSRGLLNSKPEDDDTQELELSSFGPFGFTEEEEKQYYSQIPDLKVVQRNISDAPQEFHNCVEDFQTIDSICTTLPNLCCRTISTYPSIEGRRDGDPICDRYFLKYEKNQILFSIADGCGWGRGSAFAAQNACETFIHSLSAGIQDETHLPQVVSKMLSTMSLAQDKIKSQDFPGTTTFMGGVLLPLQFESEIKWCFTFGNVGDCKVFHYSSQERKVRDLTSGNRLCSSASDCGGRLGREPQDLRNLQFNSYQMNYGDLLILTTDGVHDNFDPETLGISLQSLLTYNQKQDWGNLPFEEKTRLVENYQCQQIEQFIFQSQNLKELMDLILNHCINITKSSCTFMEANPKKKLPADYVKYPGKMDHTTICIFELNKNIN